MKTLGINVNVEVFDHPEKCGEGEEHCSFIANLMFLEKDACTLFFVKLEDDFGAVKCDQCKKAFQYSVQRKKVLEAKNKPFQVPKTGEVCEFNCDAYGMKEYDCSNCEMTPIF